MDSADKYRCEMLHKSIAKMIEDEPATVWRDVLIALNVETDDPICLSPEYVDRLLTHLSMDAGLLNDAYDRSQSLYNRLMVLEEKVVPQIRKILETVSGRDWIESEY